MTRRDRVERSIRKTAAEHPDDCDCMTCRAAAGDAQARRELLKDLV